jgi:tetratricopeptide (TPR) repeat protein
VDSLPETAKEVLQAGSAIEREFGYELIKAVTELPEQELLSQLSALKDAELIYERGILPRSRYIFRHALTQEVVYDSILAKRKKLLHERIGNAIEKMYPDNISDYYGALVDHFLAGERYEKGAEYARSAAKKAEKSASLNDAMLYGEKAIACLERLPVSDEVEKKIIDGRTVLGLYMAEMNHYYKAKEIIDPIRELAEQRGYSRRLSHIYSIIGAFEVHIQEDVPRALEYLTRALGLAEEVGDMVSAVFAHYFLAAAFNCHCQFEEALSHIEKALQINLAVNNLWGISAMKALQSLIQLLHGHVDLSYRTGIEAVSLAEQSGDIYSRLIGHACHGLSCFGRSALEEATDHLSKAVDLSKGSNQLFFGPLAHSALAETYLEIGEYENAKNCCAQAIELIDSARLFPSWSNLVRMLLQKAQVLSGGANIELEQLHRYVRDNRLKIYEGWIRGYFGEILMILNDQHFSEARHWIEEAMKADERNGMRWYLARDIAVYAELFKQISTKNAARTGG